MTRRQPVLLRHLIVLFAVGRRDVDDPGPVLGRDEFCFEDGEGFLPRLVVIIKPLVLLPYQRLAFHAGRDLVFPVEHRQPGLREDE